MRFKLNGLLTLAGSCHSFFTYKNKDEHQTHTELKDEITGNACAVIGAKLFATFFKNTTIAAVIADAPDKTIAFTASAMLLLKGYELQQSYMLGKNLGEAVHPTVPSANRP